MKKIQTGDDNAIDDSRGRKDDERYVIPRCAVCRVQCTHAVYSVGSVGSIALSDRLRC